MHDARDDEYFLRAPCHGDGLKNITGMILLWFFFLIFGLILFTWIDFMFVISCPSFTPPINIFVTDVLSL